MDLFKLVGSIVINGTDEAKRDIASVGDAARGTADAISRGNHDIENSNKGSTSSWKSMKSTVDQYKAQGLSTSAAWKKATQDMKGSTENASTGMANSFGKIGMAVGALAGGTALIGFGNSCVQAAADVQAMEAQFSQVFGDLEGKASSSLGKIADSAGISENRMKGSFTKIAAFAKTTGMDTSGALNLSERAMVAVADSAAFYDRSLEDVTESLQSFLKGNYENDAALGLSCTETTRNAAANKLYGKSFKDLSEEQKQLTLLQMVEDANKASGAIGQAARESDTWTNVTGNLKQSWKDLQAVLGAEILPKVTTVVNGLTEKVQGLIEGTKEAVKWAKEHKTIMTVIAIAIGTVAAAITAYTVAENLKNIAVAAGVAAEGSATVAMGLHTVATNIATAATTAFGAVMAFITSPITLVVAAIGVLVAGIYLLVKNWDTVKEKTLEVWNTIKTKVGSVVDSLKEKVTSVWNTITKVVETGIKIIASILSAAFQIITLPFQFIWQNCKDTIISVWNSIKEVVGKAVGVVKDKITTAFNAVKEVVSSILGAIKEKVTSVFNSIKSVASTIWNGVKTVVGNAVDAVKTKVSSVFNSVKSTVSSVFNSIKSVATSVWNGIKNAITTPINAAKDKISSIISTIKGMFSGLSLKLPDIKLPHFGISPSGWKIGDLLKGSVPKLSIKWYAEAMKNPIIMSKPTIFGYDSASGQLLGGGEAGTEVVSGAKTLMDMISQAVATQSGSTEYYLQKIVEVLSEFFPQILEEMDRPICFDPVAGAAAMAVPMNKELGRLSIRKDRGR